MTTPEVIGVCAHHCAGHMLTRSGGFVAAIALLGGILGQTSDH
jgi:hypothetical protein